MARSVTFNGITRFTPGGITRVNAEALNQVLGSDNSIVGLIGEAEGGSPGSTGGLVAVYDPSRASDLFREGPLVDAIRLAFQSSSDPAIPGGASKVYVYKTNDSTNSSISLPGSALEVGDPTPIDVAAGGTTTTIPTAESWVVDEHAGRWVSLVTALSGTHLRQIVSNDATTLTVAPALPVAPVITTDNIVIYANVLDITSKDWGLHTNSIGVDVSTGTAAGSKVVTVTFEGDEAVSPDLGGSPVLKLLFKGGIEATGDTVAAASTASVINLTTGGLTIDAEIGNQVLIGGEYTEITDNEADSITVSPALSAAPTTGGTVSIQTVTGATLAVQGSAGAATGLTTTTTGAVDNLSITFAAGQTLQQLIDIILQNSNYEASAGQGINADTTYVADLDFGTSTATTKILASTNIATEGANRDLMAIVDYLNEFSQYVNAVRSSDVGSSVAGSDAPLDTAAAVKLAGGARGISSNTEFQAGHDELLTVRCNSVVPLIDQDLINEGYSSTATVASVAAQLAGHVAFARGAGQDTAGERGGFVGFRGTKTAIIAQANALNDMDVALVGQHPTAVNGQGSLEEFGPRMLAVMAASMRAGVVEVAEPLTHKALRVSGMTQDASWNPSDVGDANELIQNGVLFAETLDVGGTRWVRDLTTWVKDSNLAYSEGSVRDAVRYVAYGLRTALVDRFTGKKAKPATIGNVKDAASTYLETARQDYIIVDSTDIATGVTVKAYHNLKVFSSGDILRINVGIFPVPGINFQLTDIFLQLPTQAA